MLPLNEHSFYQIRPPVRVHVWGALAQKDVDLLWNSLLGPSENLSGIDALRDAYERLSEAFWAWQEEDESRGIADNRLALMREFLLHADRMLRIYAAIVCEMQWVEQEVDNILSPFPSRNSRAVECRRVESSS